MATTLAAGQEELVHFSFPIEKREDTAEINPVDGTPDILITGKATDGTIDGDREIVDPEWSAKAIQEWCDTGGNVRMSHDPKRPVGKGQHVQVTTDGHYVTSLIADPLCKHFIRTGVLNDYSVGISMPDFRHRDSRLDPQGKALRIITGRADGLSRIAELSVVDRGSNFNSRFQIVRKSAGDGDEFVGKMVGDEDEIAKAAPASLTKMAHGASDTWTETSADMSGFQMPADLDITFTPNDMARLMQAKVVEKHYAGLAAKAAEPDAVKRDVSTAERRSLASEGNALPDGSYPIHNAGDLHNAAHLARTGHGNAEAAKKLIARRARELGVANPLADDGDSTSKGTVTETAAKDASGATDEEAQTMLKGLQTAMLVEERAAEAQKADAPAEETATPDVTKDPAPKPVKKAKKKPKGGKKLPPWLNKPDEGSDDNKGSSGDDGACKSVTDHLWTGTEGTSEIICSKCHTTPAEAAGLSGTHDMTCAPVPELLESPPMASTKGSPTPQSASGAAEAPAMTPVPQHREPDGAIVEPFEKDAGLPATGQGETPTRLEAGMMKASPEVAAILRFKAAGIDSELGRVHDLTCPAYHPEDVAKCHPFADFRSVLDEGYFQRKAVEAACGPSLDRAKSLHLAWQAAAILKKADPAELNDYRLAAHKAFRDANPGPSSAPTPGQISPGKYNRPLITDGHSATSTGHDGPNTSPQVATSAPDAHSFDRPPLSAGHQTPSPSFMKASFEYPHETGRPVQLDYAVMEKERARHALMQMHEHLSRQFPEVCPMDLDAPVVQPESRGVPPTAGIGKGAGPIGPVGPILPVPVDAPPVAAVLKAPAEGDLVDDAVYKGFKKMRKKLGKKVLAGKMTVDEARTHLGRQFAQKQAEDVTTLALEQVQKGIISIDEARARINLPPWGLPETGAVPAPIPSGPKPLAPVAAKAAVPAPAAPPAPVAASFGPEDIEAAVTKAVGPLLEKIQQQDDTYTTKLAEQQRVIDAIADQPDPSTAAFSGLAFNPVRKNARPAGVLSQAEAAERSQQMMIRHLTDTYNSASDAYEREAARATLTRLRGGDA